MILPPHTKEISLRVYAQAFLLLSYLSNSGLKA